MGSFLKYLYVFFFITTTFCEVYGKEEKELNISLAEITTKITGKDAFCKNEQNATITFEGEGGTPPYTFTYQIDGADQTPLSTTGTNSSVQVPVVTTTAKKINYKITKIKDSSPSEKVIDVSKTITINDLPDANFNFTPDNVCAGTTIKFTPVTTGNYSYSWDFGDKSNSKEVSPTHTFKAPGNGTQNFEVSLTIKDETTSCQGIPVKKNITVKQGPDATLNGSGGGTIYDGIPVFKNCFNNPFEFTFTNGSNTLSTNKKYKISWGDGTPDYEANTWSSVKHTYQVGLWNLLYTVEGNSGCTTEMKYIVFAGSNPAVTFGTPGNTDICISESLTFPITGTEKNPPGTKYTVSFNDGSPSEVFNHPPPTSITHKFIKSSCGTTSYTYSNSFYAKIIAENPCAPSEGIVLPIYISTPPEADFSVPPICLNTNACFTNSSYGGAEINGQSCNVAPKIIWVISPNTGVTLVSGNYGNDFGSNDPNLWQSGTETICLKFSSEGTYNLTIRTANKCGESIKTKQIKVSPLPAGNISGGATVCKDAPSPDITFNGTSGTAPFIFTYKINNGTNKTIKTTTGNSVILKAPTDNPGQFIYTLVNVQDANGCSQNQTGDAKIEVKPAPTATITGPSNTCQNAPYPAITFKGDGGTQPYTFTYNIDNGPEKTITTTSGNTVSLEVPTENLGTYTYNLVGVTDASANACTSKPTGSVKITVNQTPGSMTLIDYEYCNGVATSAIIFTNTVAGTTYSWTNSNTSIGLPASGTGNIPSFTAKNNSSIQISSTITVTPNANGCSGKSETFTIKVNPSASVIFTPGNQIVCSGENTQAVQLSSSTTGTTFSWTAVQPSGITGVITSGTDIIPLQTLTNSSNIPIDVIYKAKATVSGAASCQGAEYAYTVTVNPRPDIREIFNLSSCSNKVINISPMNGGVNSVPVGTTYTWGIPVITPDGAISGASEQKVPQSTISQTLINTTMSAATATYTVTPVFNGCAGNTFEIKLEVIPIATVNAVNDITLCNADQSSLIEFSGSPSGTVFYWTSDNSGIGITSSSGTNSIAPFTAINNGNSPSKTTLTVVPTLNGCDGKIMQFFITVNPTGQVDNPGNQNLCNGQSALINFTTQNTGGSTTYSWTNDNPAIGLQGSGSGNISFIPANSGNTIVTANINVTPTYTNNGKSCQGTTEQFKLTVNPTPGVNQPENQTLCNGALTKEVLFNGNVKGTVFNWVNDNPAIGLAASGSGDISSFLAKNNTLNPITAIISVTPNINGCSGPSKSFTITVNPAGILTSQPVSSDICLGNKPQQLSVLFINGTGPPTYQWYSNKINNYSGSIIPGAEQSSYDPPYSKADTTFYYCVITFPSGTCKTLSSEIARVAINAYPVISIINTEINSGETFTVSPNSSNGNIVPAGTTFTWSEPIISPVGSVTGASEQSDPQTFISQTLTSSALGTATVTYNVTPTSSSCKGAEFQVIVKVQPPIYTVTKVTPITCYGANDAIIEVFVSGGVAPYQIDWSNMGTGNIQTNLSPEVYSISITDAVGVQKTILETISEANLFTINPIVKQITCHGADDGRIALNFQGGEPPIILNWEDDSAAGSTRNNLGPGNYSVNIVDNQGCDINELFTIIEPLPILLSAMVTNSLGCSEQNTGEIDLTVSGGVTPYSYSWSNGSATEDLKNIPAGNYTVKVTDIIGCSNTAQYIVTRPGAIEITVVSSIKYDCNTRRVSELCTAIVKGGVPPHQIEWSTGITSGANNEFMETDQSGLVVLKVTDALGCAASHSFNTDIPVLGIENQLINCDLHSYGFKAIIGDESQKLTFLWDFGDGTISDLRNPNHDFKEEGLYPVTLLTTNTLTNCVSKYELPLQVDPRPNVVLDKEPMLCEGDTLTLYAKGTDNYRWSTGSTSNVEYFEHAGNYFVIGLANTGCTDTAYFDVSFYALRGYYIYTDKLEITNKNKIVHFWTDNKPFSNYEWDFDDGTKINGMEQYHSFDSLRDGYFNVKLQVINPDGCIESDTEKILVTVESVPNAFTPNNDGHNDIFMNGWNKKIYNRNGILMYEGVEGWDGNYKGKPVANDTYFVIVYDSSETGSQYRTGYVTVIR